MFIKNSRFWNTRKAKWVLVFLVLLILAILLSTRSGKRQKQESINQEIARSTQIQALSKDTDGDGLRDWEEAIFKTDPSDTDTDGDGTRDAEEIKTDRDPLKAGPDDLIATSTPLVLSTDDGTPESPNLTQRLAVALGQQLIAQRLMDPSQTLDPAAIGSQIAYNLPSRTPDAPLLTLKDIAVNSDQSEQAIKTWARQFDAVMQESFRGLTQPEALIFVMALQSQDFSSLAQLDKYLAAYDSAVTRVKKIPTPSHFAQDELATLRIMLQLRNIAFIFRNAEKDPVAALSAVKPYFELVESMVAINQKMRRDLDSRGINFQKT